MTGPGPGHQPTVELTVLAVPGCPHRALLEERLAAALGSRPGVAITRRVIATAAQAARAGMHGSPTLLINGVDPFAPPGQPASLSCRVHRNAAGMLEGAPSVSALRRAIGAAARLPGGAEPGHSATLISPGPAVAGLNGPTDWPPPRECP